MVGEVGDSQVVMNLPVANVPGCIGSNTKTLGLQYSHFLDMGASGGPPNGARIVHHGTDKLLIQQSTIRDGSPLLLVRRDPSVPRLCTDFFLTWSICFNQVSLSFFPWFFLICKASARVYDANLFGPHSPPQARRLLLDAWQTPHTSSLRHSQAGFRTQTANQPKFILPILSAGQPRP